MPIEDAVQEVASDTALVRGAGRRLRHPRRGPPSRPRDHAQSAEDGALGIIGACADPEARQGDLFGPQGWTGFPERLPPEPLLKDPANLAVNWKGCEAAVGTFNI